MENIDITSVAEQYRSDGYRVVVPPASSDLPEFLSGFMPDMLAKKGNENVVVKVVGRDQVNQEKHFLGYWVGKVNTQPGWRFDLVITDSSPWADKVAGDASERDIEEVREQNREVRRTLEQGLLQPASLFAWSLVEAALRILARSNAIALKNNMPAYVTKQLYSVGAISKAEFDKLQRLMTVRNSVAHGLKTSKLDERIIAEMMEMTEHLLSLAETAERSASAR